jgi:hypothetical protein
MGGGTMPKNLRQSLDDHKNNLDITTPPDMSRHQTELGSTIGVNSGKSIYQPSKAAISSRTMSQAQSRGSKRKESL